MAAARNLSKRLLGFPGGAYLEAGTEGPVDDADFDHPVVKAWQEDGWIEITEPPKPSVKANAAPAAKA